MNKFLAGYLKTLPTFTVRELQKRIITKNNPNPTDKQNTAEKHPHSNELKVLSPFYERIPQHKANCKCQFHRRQREMAQRRLKCRTQPDEIQLALLSPKAAECQMTPQQTVSHPFEDNTDNLNGNDLKKGYYDYLKTLPPIDTSKSQRKVDCHNPGFEQFLKKNHMAILDSQKIIQRPWNPSTKKIYTEGNIGFNRRMSNQFSKKDLASEKSVGISQEYSYRNSMGGSTKFQRTGYRSGQILQLIDEQDTVQQQYMKPELRNRKKVKIVNGRCSIFAAIDDKQIIKSICLRFASEDKISNEQGRRMIKQLVGVNMEVYRQVLQEIEEEMSEGINISNLETDKANCLVKIVLHKIQKEARLINPNNKYYDVKNQMLEVMCSKFGWRKDEKPMKLQEFWKLKRSSLNPSHSRSLAQSKKRLGSNIKLGSKSKFAPSEKQQSTQSRLSGFAAQRSDNEKAEAEQEMDDIVSFANLAAQQNAKGVQFKFSSAKRAGMMRSSFVKSSIVGLKSKRPFKNSTKTLSPQNDASKKATKLLLPNSAPDYSPAEPKYVLRQSAMLQAEVRPSSNRFDSIYPEVRNYLQHHIDLNKHFLRMIEQKLIQNGCNQLVIDINEGVITKKRKIRAIHLALERDSIKRSDYYQDLIKYLDIYEEYCNIVVKSKKEEAKLAKQSKRKNARQIEMEPEFIVMLEEFAKEKEGEGRQLSDLLEDLRKERELKYVTVHLIQENQNPKEELILKIPDYTTNRQEDTENIKRHIVAFFLPQQEPKYRQQLMDIEQRQVQRESCLSQKSLAEEARVTYAQCAEQQHLFECQSEESQVQTRIQRQFSKKLERYRRLLKLSVN